MFYAYTSKENQFSHLQNGPLQQCERRRFASSTQQQVELEPKQKTKKVEERGLSLLINIVQKLCKVPYFYKYLVTYTTQTYKKLWLSGRGEV